MRSYCHLHVYVHSWTYGYTLLENTEKLSSHHCTKYTVRSKVYVIFTEVGDSWR